MKNVFQNVLECVGNTPIIKLNRIGSDLDHEFYVKIEFLNPGNSVKDRIAMQMIEDAEESGELKPGGTIIECTSGNTGMGLALVASVKGYKCIFVLPDKVSSEKIKSLRAFGARVITTPTAVEPEDPRSYYSVSKRLAKETPNSFYSNQYFNPSNPKAHYRSTGPEIWEQMGSELDYLVITAGTGGTVSGTSKFLKEKNPNIKTIGVDPEGSVFYDYFKTGKVPKVFTTYKVEGFGEDFIPDTIDFKVIDEMVQVDDRECFHYTRELVKLEGIFGGGSCGAAVAAALKFARTVKGKKKFLLLLPDSGSRYLSKVYDDDWLRENGFLSVDPKLGTVGDVLGSRSGKLMTVSKTEIVRDVIQLMKKHSISQLPVVQDGKPLGLIAEIDLLNLMLDQGHTADETVEGYMDENYETLTPAASAGELAPIFREGKIAIVMEGEKLVGILTKIDLVDYLAQKVG